MTNVPLRTRIKTKHPIPWFAASCALMLLPIAALAAARAMVL